MRWFFLSLLISLVAPLDARSSCDGDKNGVALADIAADVLAEAERLEAATANARGVLWEVRAEDGARSHLFGTFEFSRPDQTEIGLRALALARRARVFFKTLSDEEVARMNRDMQNDLNLTLHGSGSPLEDWLSPRLLEAARAGLAERGITAEEADILRPWVLDWTLGLSTCDARRMQENGGGMTDLLAQSAAGAGAEVRGMTSWRVALAPVLRHGAGRQRENLRALLEYLAIDLPDRATALALYGQERVAFANWVDRVSARRSAAGPLLEAWFAREAATYADVVNPAVADRISPELERGGVFAAVDAYSLFGDSGLIERLRARGFDVRRVE